MRYLLDTIICIYIARKKRHSLLLRFEGLQADDAAMSVVTYFELIYGAYKSERIEANLATIHELAALISILPLDASTAHHYVRLRTDLERTGIPIGAYDLLIASQALSLKLTLVTNNTREFSRVAGLRV
jgi:tRNA(fMet)-specific endonuclease VapC